MKQRYRVRVLTSYIYEDGEGPYSAMGRRNRWFHGFVSTLVKEGLGLADLDVGFVKLPVAQEQVAATRETLVEDGVQLAICAGTDSVVRWAHANQSIPTLYFGAHPENNGLELAGRPNVRGVRLNLPLIWSYRNFALLRELLPELSDIYFPINLESEFAFPNVRVLYEDHRAREGGPWIPGESGRVGHRSIHFLAERLGCRYHEGPYTSLEELRRALEQVDPRRSAVVGFNDTVLQAGAVDVLLSWAKAQRGALFWVNNWPIVSAGGVADFSSDFEKVGALLGRLALRVLRDGVPIHQLRYEEDPGERFGLNLRRCAELSIQVPPATRARFHAFAE